MSVDRNFGKRYGCMLSTFFKRNAVDMGQDR